MCTGVIRWELHRCAVTASKVLWTQSRDRGAWGMSKTVRLELIGLSGTDDDELLSLGSPLRRSLLEVDVTDEQLARSTSDVGHRGHRVQGDPGSFRQHLARRVGSTWRVLRTSSGTSSLRSRAEIVRESGGCVMPRRSAGGRCGMR